MDLRILITCVLLCFRFNFRNGKKNKTEYDEILTEKKAMLRYEICLMDRIMSLQLFFQQLRLPN